MASSQQLQATAPSATEDLDQEVFLADYWISGPAKAVTSQSAANASSGSNVYTDATAATGDILPWGVKAVWDGQDITQINPNAGSGAFAFVIDSGVLPLDDFNINTDVNSSNFWSKSFVAGDENPFSDGNGHGTHVAGTIAAKADGKGVVGVAPGAEVISIKVFNSSGGGASYNTIIAAVDYTVGIILGEGLPLEKTVINMSLGGPLSVTLENVIKSAANQGIQFSIAAGNDAIDVDGVSPASAGDMETVYTVSATDNKYMMANFSNWDNQTGGDDVDVAAPGVNVQSYYKNGELAYLNGTSMAAPAVAGLLITGGVKNGVDVSPNSAGFGDPFALAVGQSNNSSPLAIDDIFTVQVGGSTPLDILSNDSDLDGDQLSIVSINGIDVSSGTGTVNLIGFGEVNVGSNNFVSVSATAAGTTSFTYTVSDGTATATATVTLVIEDPNGGDNEAPVAIDDAYVLLAGESTLALDLLGNDTDANGDPLSIVKVGGSVIQSGQEQFVAVDNGIVSIASNGAISFAANDGFAGTTSFSYEVSDGSEFDMGMVEIEVQADDTNNPPPNDELTISLYGNATGSEGSYSMSTGYGSENQSSIESALGLSLGLLDTNLGGTKSAINATEGSSVKIAGFASAGDKANFSFKFATNDYTPFGDFGFYSVNGEAYSLAAVGDNVADYGSSSGNIQYEFTVEDFGGNSSGEINFGFGVLDGLDFIVDSYLQIESFYIESDNSGDPETPPPPSEGFNFYQFGNAAGSNTSGFTMTTGTGSISQYYVESSLGLNGGILDTSLGGTKGSVNATEGSAIKGITFGKAGDILTFKYSFASNDYQPYKDFGFYSVNGNVAKIAAVGEDVPNYGSSTGQISYTLSESDFNGAASGNVILGLGVMDALDTAVDTKLIVKDILLVDVAGGGENDDSTELIYGFNSISYVGNASNATLDQYLMSTGYGAVSQSLLEQSLKLLDGVLDSSLNGTKSAVNATEGSGIQAKGVGKAGDKISFDYYFSTADYTPFKDFSFYAVNDNAYKVVAIGEDVPNYGSKSGTVIYTLQADDFESSGKGNFALSIGVVDGLDSGVDSSFQVENIQYIEIDESDETPPGSVDLTFEAYGNSFGSAATNYWKMTTGSGSISQNQLEQQLGIAIDELDSSLNGSKVAANATEGSGLKIQGSANAGDVVNVSYKFSSNDYAPFKDYSFVSVNGEAENIADIGGNVANYGNKEGVYTYTFTDADFGGSASGSFEISFGIVDVLDTAVDSKFEIFDFTISAPGSTPPPSDPSDPGQPPSDKTGFLMETYGNAFASPSGTYKMSTGSGAASQFSLEQSLNLDIGVLDSTLNGTKDAINATEGSALKATATASVGDVISFAYAYNTNDYIPYQDFSFYSVNGVAKSLSVTGVDTPSYGYSAGMINYTVTSADLGGGTSGNIQLAIGVLDALDTVVDTSLEITNLVISSDAKATDVDGNGLIDGLDIYIATNSDNEAVKLQDSNGVIISKEASPKWDIAKAVSTSASNINVLLQGITDEFSGKLKVVTAGSNGNLNESLDAINDVTSWASIEDAVAFGFETDFGLDLNQNGFIDELSITSTSAEVTLGGKQGQQSVVLKDLNGNAVKKFSDDLNILKAVGLQSFSIFSSGEDLGGYQVLVQGENENVGKYSIWDVGADGATIFQSSWTSATNAAASGWEDIFGKDLNNNGLIDSSDGIKLANDFGSVLFKGKKSQVLSNEYSDLWDAKAAVSTPSGYSVLVEGTGSTAGQVLYFKSDAAGINKGSSKWFDSETAIQSGWEKAFKYDINDNGLLDGYKYTVLSTDYGTVSLKNKQSKLFKNSSVAWNVAEASQGDNGFNVLLEGQGSKEGQLYAFSTDKFGKILQGSGWVQASTALELGWEAKVYIDLNKDGILSGGTNVLLNGQYGPVALTASSGVSFKAVNSNWEAVKAVQTQAGHDVLIKGKGKNMGSVYVFNADDTGVVTGNSGWLSNQIAVSSGLESQFVVDIDSNGLQDGAEYVQFFSDSGSVAVLKAEGKALYSQNKNWQAIAAKQADDTFEVLLKGKGAKTGKSFIYYADTDGNVMGGTGWINDESTEGQNIKTEFGVLTDTASVSNLPLDTFYMSEDDPIDSITGLETQYGSYSSKEIDPLDDSIISDSPASTVDDVLTAEVAQGASQKMLMTSNPVDFTANIDNPDISPEMPMTSNPIDLSANTDILNASSDVQVVASSVQVSYGLVSSSHVDLDIIDATNSFI